MKKHIVFIFVFATVFIVACCLYFLAPSYIDSFLIFVVGVVMCWVAIASTITIYECKEKVTAVFVNYGFEQFKAHLTSSPIFTYTYQGKKYTEKSAECLSQRYALRHFKKGEVYTVYISAKDPSFVKVSRKIRLFDIVLFLLGMLLAVLSIVSVAL